jgi:hypothetical protein
MTIGIAVEILDFNPVGLYHSGMLDTIGKTGKVVQGEWGEIHNKYRVQFSDGTNWVYYGQHLKVVKPKRTEEILKSWM